MTNLSNLTQHTKVTFPQGKVSGVSRVVYTQRYDDGKTLVFVEETPFHPLSCSWPDQQADTGALKISDKEFRVFNTLTAAINLEDENGLKVYLDSEIPPRHSAPGWRFFVAHIINDQDGNLADTLIGKEVELLVDAERRKLLSAAHTSTHLAALALNKQSGDLWRKEVEKDGLDHADLDRLAMEKSIIEPGKAIDKYRFGKSLRKKGGFDTAMFFERLEQTSEAVNRQLAEWIATDAPVIIETAGPELEARRSWTCQLDGKLVKFPCGGTHLTHLGELEAVEVTFEPSSDMQEMTMHTAPRLT